VLVSSKGESRCTAQNTPKEVNPICCQVARRTRYYDTGHMHTGNRLESDMDCTPVDGGVRHQRRKLPEPSAERVSDRGKHQHDMKELSNLHAEEIEEIRAGAVHADLFGASTHRLTDRDLVACVEEVGYLAKAKEVRNVLYHRLVLYLSVAEQEHRRFPCLAGCAEHRLEVVAPIAAAVATGKLHLHCRLAVPKFIAPVAGCKSIPSCVFMAQGSLRT
jgi:hypothetical protein